MTNAELECRMHKMVKLEKRLSHEIVRLIQISYARKLHLHRGYKSVFEWLTKEFKYSEGAANRRISAAKILDAVPEAAAKLESGELNLSTLTQAQSAIRREEKRTGEKISAEQKHEIVAALDHKTMAETEKYLATVFPEAAPTESMRSLNADHDLLQLPVDAEFVALLEDAKALLSNTGVTDTLETLKSGLKAVITAAAAKQSVRRRTMMERANSRCEYVDNETDRRCTSTHSLEEDHVQPKAKGGSDAIENRRMLCKAHNLLEAEREYGVRKIRGFAARTANPTEASRRSSAGSR